MSKPITKVELTGFRGASTTFSRALDPTKGLTMLFGENGDGKSTILDAIDIVCNGKAGSLDDISVGQSSGDYLCSLGHPKSSVKLVIHSQEDSWVGTMQHNVIVTSGPSPKPRVKILRRSKVLSLVTAQPKTRYEALSEFIAVDGIAQSEEVLRLTVKEVKAKLDGLGEIAHSQRIQLTKLWEVEGYPGPGPLAIEWAQVKVDAGIAGLKARYDRLKEVVNAIQAAVEAKDDYKLKVLSKVSATKELATITQEITEAPSLNAATAMLLIDSLSRAQKYIKSEPGLDKCPTCQREMPRDELLAIVDAQLDKMTVLKDLNYRINEAKRLLDIASSKVSDSERNCVTAIQKVHHAVTPNDIAEVVALKITWPDWSVEPRDYPELVNIAESVESVQVELTQKADDAHRDISQLNSIKTMYDSILEGEKTITDLDRIHDGLQRVLKIVHDKRVAFTQGILDEITDEANRLFQAIHPGENINLTALSMVPERQGSVCQWGSFYRHHDILPQAVFSDSHLDTLGFCVWLALAKRDSPKGVILLIDDIFSSVDAPHLERVMDLLLAEKRNFLQIIIATHYRFWWNQSQNAPGVERIQLGQWSLTNGISAENVPTATQKLLTLIKEPVLDRQAVSSKAGILLEMILNELSMCYKLPVPLDSLKRNTLGELQDACDKLFTKRKLTVKRNVNWMSPEQPEAWDEMDAKTPFIRIKEIAFIRNQVGCHFSPPGTEIPDCQVREFGQATVDLVDAIVCPNCGSLANKLTNDRTALRCTCPRQAIRMTPVVSW